MSTYVSFCIHFPQFLANSSSFNFSLYVNFSIPWISSIIDSHCLHCGMSAFSQFFVIVFLLAVRRIFTRYRSSLATHSTKCPRYKTVHVQELDIPGSGIQLHVPLSKKVLFSYSSKKYVYDLHIFSSMFAELKTVYFVIRGVIKWRI